MLSIGRSVCSLALLAALAGCETVKDMGVAYRDFESWTCCSSDDNGKDLEGNALVSQGPEPIEEVFYTKSQTSYARSVLAAAMPLKVPDPADGTEPYVMRSAASTISGAGASPYTGDWLGLYNSKPLSRRFTPDDVQFKYCNKVCEVHTRYSKTKKDNHTKIEIVYLSDGDSELFAHQVGTEIRKYMRANFRDGFGQPQEQVDHFNRRQMAIQGDGALGLEFDAWANMVE